MKMYKYNSGTPPTDSNGDTPTLSIRERSAWDRTNKRVFRSQRRHGACLSNFLVSPPQSPCRGGGGRRGQEEARMGRWEMMPKSRRPWEE